MRAIALASSSPRRRELLKSLGFELTFLDPNIDEASKPGESPRDLVLRLAKEKAEAVASQTNLPIIAADTIVIVGDEILGKPEDKADAGRMIKLLSDREHQVLTGYAVLYRGVLKTNLVQTDLVFRNLSEYEIERYLDTNEWVGKSGAYPIQATGGSFVDHMTGSLTNVLGLPLTEVLKTLDSVS